jgi:hypothetical protein
MKIYRYNTQGIFTGEVLDVSPKAAIPGGYTHKKLPEIPEGKYAQFDMFSWRIIDTLPPQQIPPIVEAA